MSDARIRVRSVIVYYIMLETSSETYEIGKSYIEKDANETAAEIALALGILTDEPEGEREDANTRRKVRAD